MIYITFKDYKREAATLKDLVKELRQSKRSLQDEVNINRARLSDDKTQHEHDSDQIRDLKLKVSDLQDSNTDLQERLEKEQYDNCELQNLYAGKRKECESLDEQLYVLNVALDNLNQEKSMLDEKLKSYERDGYVVVKEDHYNELKTVYEKKQKENETRNANRRKSRAAKTAAKKVAQGKPGN